MMSNSAETMDYRRVLRESQLYFRDSEMYHNSINHVGGYICSQIHA